MRDLMMFCRVKGLYHVSDELFALLKFRKGGEEEGAVSALALVGDEGEDGRENPMDPTGVHVIYRMSKDFGAAGIRSVSCFPVVFSVFRNMIRHMLEHDYFLALINAQS